jgi:hypothetical protein
MKKTHDYFNLSNTDESQQFRFYHIYFGGSLKLKYIHGLEQPPYLY